jgi:SAM-dependent methyltransferase
MITIMKSDDANVVEKFKNTADELCMKLAALELDIEQGNKTPEDGVDIIVRLIRSSCTACSEVEENIESRILEMQEYLRDRIEPFFSQSWFMHRAVTKPRGYPGDYKILEAIYDGNPKTHGLGKALDLYFLQSDLARAVRGRKNKCREIIRDFVPHHTDGSMRILDIASGPCRELHGNGGNGLSPFKFVGIDNDEVALSYARNAVLKAGYDKNNFEFRKHNVLRLTSGEKNIDTFGKFDLIYSVGLYDYLPDKILLRVLKGSSEMLNENGRYVVAFKDCKRYDKNEYQWHVDWHFFPRTEEECRKIVTDSGMRIVKTERDETGIIIFYTLERMKHC